MRAPSRWNRLDEFLLRLAPLLPLESGSRVVVDLSSVDHPAPQPLRSWWRHSGVTRPRGVAGVLTMFPPQADELRRALAGEAFNQLLSPAAGRRPALDVGAIGFDGCEPFSNGEGITRAVYALLASVRQRVALREEMIQSLGALLSELAENVLDMRNPVAVWRRRPTTPTRTSLTSPLRTEESGCTAA